TVPIGGSSDFPPVLKPRGPQLGDFVGDSGASFGGFGDFRAELTVAETESTASAVLLRSEHAVIDQQLEVAPRGPAIHRMAEHAVEIVVIKDLGQIFVDPLDVVHHAPSATPRRHGRKLLGKTRL